MNPKFSKYSRYIKEVTKYVKAPNKTGVAILFLLLQKLTWDYQISIHIVADAKAILDTGWNATKY